MIRITDGVTNGLRNMVDSVNLTEVSVLMVSGCYRSKNLLAE